MKPYFFIQPEEDHLSIRILPNLKPILRFGFWCQIVGSFVIPLLYILQYFPKHVRIDVLIMAIVPMFIFQYLLATRTYLKNVFLTEYIEVYPEHIKCYRKIFKKKLIKTIPVDEHTQLVYGVSSDFSTHTLAGKTFDYYGFDTTQKEINFLIEEGAIMLVNKDLKYRFGKNVPSWDAKEMIGAMEKFTGKKLLNRKLAAKQSAR